MSRTQRTTKTVVVGIDDHDASRDAASLGAALANALGAELALAAAEGRLTLGADGTALGASRHERLDRMVGHAAGELGDFPYRRFELEGDAAGSLQDLAAREEADLLVIGQTHRGRLGRVFPGTLADKLLQGTPCPVAVAPRGHADHPHAGFGVIGVAYDGGEEARAALELARDMARDLDCTVQVITVAPTYEGVDDPLAEVRESVYRERLNVGVRAVDRQAAEGVFDRGHPARALARHGVELDLLVIGSHPRGPMLRTALGSVGSELMRISPCPVIIAPRGAIASSNGAPRALAGRPRP